MNEHIERLRASRAEYENNEREQGQDNGREWALAAEYPEVEAVAGLDPDEWQDADGALVLIANACGHDDLHDLNPFIETEFGHKPSLAFLRGHVEGVREVFEQV